MDLCVVIAARNEEAHLAAQLDALLAQRADVAWEVVVVDNGSTDGTAALVEGYAAVSERVRLVHADEVADKAYAIEQGVGASAAGALAFCDADDIVATGWVEAMARALEAYEVVTGPNELDVLNPPWLAASRGRSIEQPVGSFGGVFPTIRGNNFGVRRSAWDTVGPLERGWWPLEDVEFSLRCWLHGITVTGVPTALVHYRYRCSARDLWRQGWAYGSNRPRVAARLRQLGRPRPGRLAGWRSWARLLLTLPAVVTRPGRAQLAWAAGNRFGQVAGSIRFRTLML